MLVSLLPSFGQFAVHRPLKTCPPPERARRRRRAWVTPLTSGLSVLVFSCAPVPYAEEQLDSDVTIDTEDLRQRLEGFGASVAWYQSALPEHPRKQELYEHLFADLGLDILRFRNVYGREGSEIEAEAEIVEQATKSLGHPPRVLLTSWSPPVELKANEEARREAKATNDGIHLEDCQGEATCTLKRLDGDFVYDQFAQYWLDSVRYYEGEGIPVTYVSMQNEPDYTPNGWEGCRFAPTEDGDQAGYAEALAVVHRKLAELDEPPKLLGPETLGVHGGRVERYLGELDRDHLYGVAHHLYEQGGDGVWDWSDPGPDSYTGSLARISESAGELPVFQTEFGTDDDEFVRGGFETAWLIHNALAGGNASAFLYWELFWPGKGLIALGQGEEYTLRDQYYSLRHFARFTDPGDRRVGVGSRLSQVLVSAYLSRSGDRLTVVALNVSGAPAEVTVNLGSWASRQAEAYRTVYDPGASQTWIELDEDLGSRWSLPPRSVMTLVLR